MWLSFVLGLYAFFFVWGMGGVTKDKIEPQHTTQRINPDWMQGLQNLERTPYKSKGNYCIDGYFYNMHDSL